MISLLFVAVNSALLGRALFLQLYAVFGWDFNTYVRISNALLITVGEFSMVLTETPDYSDTILKYNCNFSGQGNPHWG